ncbi:MAG: serS [Marmoricola sp.]|nr:serS [Marmoricola sp.]
MIDPRLLREDPDQIRAAQTKRGLPTEVVDRALEADAARRTAIADFEQLRAEQKQLGKLIPKATGEEKAELLTRTRTLSADVKAAEAAQAEAEADWRQAVLAIPNPAADEAPAGGEEDFTLRSEHGTRRDFAAEGFTPRDHLELGRILGAIDVERGAKVSGSRFYYLVGIGADLELALVNLAMDQARSAGFTTMIPPALVKPRAMEGTGFLGQAADDVYRIEGQDTYLVGTSEVPLAAYHSDEILDASTLPRRYVAFSPCFRKEAGSHGKDTRGIFRVHWFDKVEMFTYTTLEEAAAEHERLLAWEMEFLDKLELSYRVIDVAAGDLGLSAQRKFDCEAWIPSQERYRELTSTSNCTDFQTRRLDVRGRFPSEGGQGETGPVATLNGTLVAITRAIVALLETHQQADGSVRVPAALQPYLQGREVLLPVGGAGA